MVVLQILNKILETNDYSIVEQNNLSKDMFIEYEHEFEFINEFHNKYGKVPDKETFLGQFPEFSLIDVTETDQYLLDKLNEEYLYFKTVPVLQNLAEKLKQDSGLAVDYLLKEIPNLTALKRTERNRYYSVR